MAKKESPLCESAILRNQDPQSTPAILRNHVLYQKSYVQEELFPLPKRCSSKSPERHRPNQKSKCNKKNVTTQKPEKKRSSSASLVRAKARNGFEQLEYRRLQRKDRERPWLEKPPKVKNNNGTIKLFYDQTLPTCVDKTKVTLRARKYVANSKYGNIYEIREETPKCRKATKSPQPRKWIWEEEFLLWMKGSREKYMEEIGSARTKQNPLLLNSGSQGSTNTNTPRPGSLPSIRETVRPSADVYAAYNSHRLERTRRHQAAIVIQRIFRGWHVRHVLKRLKRKTLLEHGRQWLKFIAEYRQLISRIRSRYGMMKQVCPIDLKQIEDFLNRKYEFEKKFRQFVPDGKLPKDDLMEFFNRCDLWPTQREINRSFDTIFRGSRNTAEVVFVLDCSSSTGITSFHSLIKFVKDLVLTLDIAPDRTRVGVVPFNEDIFNAFSITAYNNKREVLDAISRIKLWNGLTRTDLALKLMREMFKDSRPGVQKIGIVITDGQSTYREKTEMEARKSREMGIEMIAIGIGSKADVSELQLIATKPDNLFHILDVKLLDVTRRQIEKRFCLAILSRYRNIQAPTQKKHILPRIHRYGILQNEAIDIIWTTFPPRAVKASTTHSLQRFHLDTPTYAPIQASSTKHMCRPIDQSEALEVVWTCYPPAACNLSHVRSSRWIRPIVDGKEAWSALDDNIIRATGMKACLRLVIQARLQRHGYITLPSDVTDDVEQVTSETQTLQLIEKFLEDKQSETMKQKQTKF